MNTYSGYEYLMIDIANQFGNDKVVFEERIQWVHEHMDELETLAEQAETKPLYIKAVMALRKAQKGIPTGHLVGLDGVCSGLQIMSCVTGCVAGATATGLVDPDRRADAYTQTTDTMNRILGGGVEVERSDAKRALMTSCYGSEAVPVDVFGKDTPELAAFYEAMLEICPGAWELLQVLKQSWQPYALSHGWELPDGYRAHVPVMEKLEARIEVDELDHTTFTYAFEENVGSKKGISNVANVVHSLDAWVLRSMHRRCNYDKEIVEQAYVALLTEKQLREDGLCMAVPVEEASGKLKTYLELFYRTNIVDVVILPYLHDVKDTQFLPTDYLERLIQIVEGMLAYVPFALVGVHDEFKCHANYCNHMRQQYINILAELAESCVIDDILSQIHGVKGTYPKKSDNLGELIRKSNYALS